ncbi:patatin-like phospholipase family protein [Burkholderia stagnalis]|uniref:PNPLA domain-containing protein n=2 Tax=Burkholderia stagnalis TaxID=1503054 RepID=A0ABX9YID9_9BURK|nr:patatin-like phospholipase family protein [Burkholderia stagnalis]RQQ44525.1 hypothetical protein DF145_26680 [Burkholderia stagnalis]RQQ53881.1 hypothetical protein DF158_27325 [Burkholderia stagnalis]RQQ63293.1 hypothetical protein DF137_26655 [Burkholderia stagnalis]RQQ64188.1 hypothetical protein DF139_26210 [Burkholderia stagnalis]RQQ77121.1 hypothetical protein DF138_26260 [Burkholderia stagnalis]
MLYRPFVARTTRCNAIFHAARPQGCANGPAWALPIRYSDRELEQAERHRKAVGLDPAHVITAIPGLAISGGGIRSAIFALGVMQAMAERDVLKHFSYLSTVSGGSYIGAFYGSLFVPDGLRIGNQQIRPQRFQTAAEKAAKKLRTGEPASGKDAITPIAYLRDNCNYLTPNGLHDILQAIVFSTRNWFAIQYVVGVSLLTILLWLNLSIASLMSLAPAAYRAIQCDTRWIVASVPLASVVCIVILIMSPLSRAYWLTQNLAQKTSRLGKSLPFASLLLVMALAMIAIRSGLGDSPLTNSNVLSAFWKPPYLIAGGSLVLVTGMLGVVYLVGAWLYVSRKRGSGKSWFPGSMTSKSSPSDSRPFVDRLRNALSNAYTTPIRLTCGVTFLTGAFQMAIWLAALAAIDALGSFLFSKILALETQHGAQAAALTSGGSLAVLAGLGGSIWAITKFVMSEGKGIAEGLMKLPRLVLATIGAGLAALLTLTFWSVVAHAVTAKLGIFACSMSGLLHCDATTGYFIGDLPKLLVVCLILLSLALIDGLCVQFLNLSTYQRLYSMRLTRAFLGATNNVRLDHASHRDVTSLVRGDSITLGEYYHRYMCAPVHLINATINKTIDWDSSLVQRGARGLSFCVGPAGMTVGAKLGVLQCKWEYANDISTPATHIRGNASTRDIWLESLTLGDWVAISGAAVSTGLGKITHPGYSLLLGVTNIRLGYWWDTYSTPFSLGAESYERVRVPIPTQEVPRRLFTEKFFGTQFCLKSELLGEFDGPRARRWYLTDGGHFENTGAYELLRRQLKFIVVLDNGSDPTCQFTDVGALIHQARVDFGIEISETATHISSPNGISIDARFVAMSFDAFKRQSSCMAVLLAVKYPKSGTGQLLVIKPRITPLTPYDARCYAFIHTSFPNESTADQFFNEVQWESYRALGEAQARALFT